MVAIKLKMPSNAQMFFINGTAMGYYFLLWFISVYCCLFLTFPLYCTTNAIYYWNLLLLSYSSLNMMGNYTLGVLNPSVYKNGVLLNADDVPRSWRLCMTCQQHCPPRSHHCSVCNACVLKRDHHCFFFGSCVGLNNLKYFIPYTLHVCLGSAYVFHQVAFYLDKNYKEMELSWSFAFSYTCPGIFYNYWFNQILTFNNFVCIMALYGLLSTGLGSAFLFIGNMIFALRGQTSHENNKGIRSFNRGPWKNFQIVFGKFGLLCFLIPLPNKTRELNSPWGVPKFVKGI